MAIKRVNNQRINKRKNKNFINLTFSLKNRCLFLSFVVLYSSKKAKAVYKNAGVAQSVEQLIRNQQVSGSSPLSSSIKSTYTFV